MNGITKALLLSFLVILLAAGGIGYTAWRFIILPASESDAVVVFEVRPGESFKTTAKRLQDDGLVSSGKKLELYARVSGLSGKARVGEYAIRKNMTPKEVLAIITTGHSVEYVVTIQEGFNRFEIADSLEKQGLIKKEEFLELTRDPALIRELLGENLTSLEGYLFPETYHITKFTGAKGLVRMMVERFKQNFAKVQMSSHVNMSRHELVTLASIVEKETGAPEERPVISSVFHNRLRKNMRLQTDPTVIYGIWEQTGIWNRNISRNDLLAPSRYNTYTFSGLPYGPISNPGLQAMQAAANPAQTDYLFFVSRNDGTHVFSQEYSQHLKAVGDFQLNAKAREGKSWRDLQKREKVPDAVTEAPTLSAQKRPPPKQPAQPTVQKAPSAQKPAAATR